MTYPAALAIILVFLTGLSLGLFAAGWFCRWCFERPQFWAGFLRDCSQEARDAITIGLYQANSRGET